MTGLGYTTVRGEPFRGWRCWRVLPFTRLDGTETCRLCAVGTLGLPKVWEPREANRAVCSDYGSHHEAPWPDHECGIWALKDRDDAHARMVGFMDSQGGGPLGWAFGPVSLWGRLIEHEHGYRAQYAYPYSLTVESTDERVATMLRGEYAVDVEWAGGDLFEKVTALKTAKEAKKALAAELEQMKERLTEIESMPLDDPAPWRERYFSISHYEANDFVEAVREAQNSNGDARPATSREVCVALALNNGYTEEDVRHEHYRMGNALREVWMGERVLQYREKHGPPRALWGIPGCAVPDSYELRVDLRAAEDMDALATLYATLKATRKKSACTRTILEHVGRVGASASEKTKLAGALGRQIHRGNVYQLSTSYSEPNQWALTQQGKERARRGRI